MADALMLLNEFPSEDIEWILSSGDEQRVITNTRIINEGEFPECIFILLQGLIGIQCASCGESILRVLGPGEIIGEISYLEKVPASATVSAVENSLLLALPHQKLNEKLDHDSAFAVNFYKSLALLNSRRLRETVGILGGKLAAKGESDQQVTRKYGEISEVVLEFKQLLQRADTEALKNHGVVPTPLRKEVQLGFSSFWRYINTQIGEASPISQDARNEIGIYLKMEILPYLLLTQTTERFYSKPRGYAGDYLTIQMIYDNEPSGAGRIGSLIDECFLNQPSAKAVRNRRGLLAGEILKIVEHKKGSAGRVTSLACGPAAEVFDVYSQLRDPDCLNMNLIDIDFQALAFVKDKLERSDFKRQINLIQGNLVYLATGRQKLDIKRQDLVYSIGLIDYFNDKFVIKLMDYIYDILSPGGKVILGNFHPNNIDRAAMDHLLDWKLIHRDENDMNRLFSESKFGTVCSNLRFESEGTNLFAECVKYE